MAMVNCPGCNKKADDRGKTCPDCGTLLQINLLNVFSKNIPSYMRLRLIGQALMYIGCGLVLLELFEVIQTFVGTLLIGLGFLLHGVSLLNMMKEKEDKRKTFFIIGLGAFIFIAGVVFVIF
jgi:uncharacterized membrane protein HdeD (DUF308 family)